MMATVSKLSKDATAGSLRSLSTGTSLQKSRVAIIGGSIGGCAAAIALQRAGLESSNIDVFERSAALDLADRGLGIGFPHPVFDQLVKHDMVDAHMKYVETQGRQWILKNDTYNGRVLYEPEMKVQLHNWGLLWQQLRKRVSDASYHSGVSVDLTKTKIDSSSKTLELVSSSSESLGDYDFCIQADGALTDTQKANYAGYVLWRGSFPVQHHSNISLEGMPETFFTPVFPNGHGIFYLMPASKPEDGEYLLNFGIYTPTPPGLQGEYLSKVTRGDQITHQQLEFFQETALSQMPPRFQDMIQVCLQLQTMTIHPILDRVPESFQLWNGLGILLGDAGAVLRPHTASGTTKAVGEALLLHQLLLAHDAPPSWQAVAQAYQEDRQGDAVEKVALGERLGRAQVLETPHWESMLPSDFEEWLAAQVSNTGNYMYKHLERK